mmetsp:Transcript_5689/g.35399  ORF Transcript_5689/g.35399 Transcript_5689/m.35399 type:complete len:86 (+) Transcript_5689:984-1241(+)
MLLAACEYPQSVARMPFQCDGNRKYAPTQFKGFRFIASTAHLKKWVLHESLCLTAFAPSLQLAVGPHHRYCHMLKREPLAYNLQC